MRKKINMKERFVFVSLGQNALKISRQFIADRNTAEVDIKSDWSLQAAIKEARVNLIDDVCTSQITGEMPEARGASRGYGRGILERAQEIHERDFDKMFPPAKYQL